MKEKGITLIALVITIIIMLILIGTTIAFSINEGILSKAINGSEKYKQNDEYESGLPEEISEYIDDTINGNNEIIDCIIEITGHSGPFTTVEVTKTEAKRNIVGYVYLLDNKVINISNDSKYEYPIYDSNYHLINVEVIDENGNAKKSNTIKYKSDRVRFLYLNGEEYIDITGGWIAGTEASAYNGISEKREKEMFLSYKSRGMSGSYVKTNKAIDVSKYDKVGILTKMQRSAGGSYTKLYAVNKDIPYGNENQESLYEIDISNNQSITPFFENWDTDVHIYAVWVENTAGEEETVIEKSNKIEKSNNLDNVGILAKWAERGEFVISSKEDFDNENISGYAVLVNGSIVGVNFGIEAQIPYDEDVTNKKVEFLMFDKDGNYYRFEYKNMQIIKKMYLYKYGDECIDITGGWKTEKLQSNGIVEKKESEMFLSYKSTGGSGSRLKTNNEIEISEYEKAFIRVKMVKKGGTSYTNLWAFVKNIPYGNENQEYIYEIDISEKKKMVFSLENYDTSIYIYEIWVE